jgi:hypothetical protein
MDNQYGLLIKEKDILLHRRYFKEMTELLGVKVIHRAPRQGKTYTTYSEIDSNYFEPELVPCIFDEHPTQRTLKTLGWVSELQESPSIISVPYDTKGLQQGSLFIIPSAFDKSMGRLFRVVEIAGQMIYPASLTCKLVPEYENTFSPSQLQHQSHSFTLLNREED